MGVLAFKENINRIMQEKNISQAQLSRLTGIKAPSICRIVSFSNSDCVSARNLERLAKALNVTMDELFMFKNDEVENNNEDDKF